MSDTQDDTDAALSMEDWQVKEGDYDCVVYAGDYAVATVHNYVPGTPVLIRARLIAAAGNSAHEAAEMGYDGQKAVEGLPQLIEAAEEGSHRKVQAVLAAMRGAEGSGDD